MSTPDLQSITGVALQQLGSVGNFREILDVNPAALPFELPPQVQQGIDIANQVLDLTGSNFKIPGPDEVLSGLTSVLGNLGNLGTADIQEVASGLEATTDTDGADLLQSISWLL